MSRKKLIFVILSFAVLFCFLFLKFKNHSFKKKHTVFENCVLVDIPSTYDTDKQKAFFYRSRSTKPLIVSLHSWGGTYSQKDSLALFSYQQDWNYIHPDYRGAQWNPNSCCFPPSVQDIDDAIHYAILHGNVDTNNIFVIGKSGGGSGVLAAFLKSKFKNLNCMAWSPITDHVAWHDEVLLDTILKKKYFNKILIGTNSKDTFNVTMAKAKSVQYMVVDSFSEYKSKKLTIYEGILDGIKGSTSIAQSIKFYNHLLQKWNVSDSNVYVDNKEFQHLFSERTSIKPTNTFLGKRKIIHSEQFNNVKLILFDGDHEILFDAAINELKKNHKIN